MAIKPQELVKLALKGNEETQKEILMYLNDLYDSLTDKDKPERWKRLEKSLSLVENAIEEGAFVAREKRMWDAHTNGDTDHIAFCDSVYRQS